MNKASAAFIVGFIFALGLGIAGMTQPQKVIGFLDLTAWDPSLMFVMVGAIGVHALMYPLIMKRKSPLLDTQFHLPTSKEITKALVIGAFIFGLGWGIGGYCPGPAIASLATGQVSIMVFLVTMSIGMYAYRKFEKAFPHKR